MTQSALHAVADDGRAHSLAHHETYASRTRARRVIHQQMDDQASRSGSASPACRCPKRVRIGQTVSPGKHGVSRGPRASDSQALAALAPPGRQDGTAGAGAHAQAEAVRLRPTTVVRLVRTLAHEINLFRWWFRACRPGQSPGAKVDFGRHRTSALDSPAWTCGTPREPTRARPSDRVTCQRYALARSRVKPARELSRHRHRHLWMTGCPGPDRGVKFGLYRGSLPSRSDRLPVLPAASTKFIKNRADLPKQVTELPTRCVSADVVHKADARFTACG